MSLAEPIACNILWHETNSGDSILFYFTMTQIRILSPDLQVYCPRISNVYCPRISKDGKGNERFGEVIKLNQKTAGVLVGTTRWKVGYSLLSSIIEGELGSERSLIEGRLPGRE